MWTLSAPAIRCDMDNKTKNIALSGVLAAAVLLLTMISLPLPSGSGYIHLGDAAVLLCAVLLPVSFGWVAAGCGAALADIILGFAMYAPATFVIKALMALCAGLLIKFFKGKWSIAALIISALIVPLGYLAYEALILDIGVSAFVNIPLNALQSTVGAALCYIVQLLIGRKQKV